MSPLASALLLDKHLMQGEAPGADKDVSAVAAAADQAKLAYKVAWVEPLVCIKG